MFPGLTHGCPTRLKRLEALHRASLGTLRPQALHGARGTAHVCHHETLAQPRAQPRALGWQDGAAGRVQASPGSLDPAAPL